MNRLFNKMDVSVPPEEFCKILEEVRSLLKDCLIPRLDKLEHDLWCLRRHTWPVCAVLSEESPLGGEWFRDKAASYDGDEYLLIKKEKISRLLNPGDSWRRGRLEEEKKLLLKYNNGAIV
jgi:hypothetical protein